MKTKVTILLNLFLLLFALLGFPQGKYAIILTGDPTPEGDDIVPPGHIWPQPDYPTNEFWHDTFLMNKLLEKNGFLSENIFVLYDEGEDFAGPDYNPNYVQLGLVEYEATIPYFISVMNSLNGLNESDFLFIFIFSHGGFDSNGQSVFWLRDGSVSDIDLADWLDGINAGKIVVWMVSCGSGGFAEELEVISDESSKILFTSCSDSSQKGHRADGLCLDPFVETPPPFPHHNEKTNEDIAENEFYLYEEYHHSEFFFHMYSVCNGESPPDQSIQERNWYSYLPADPRPPDPDKQFFLYGDDPTLYGGNQDNIISFSEAFNWLDLNGSMDSNSYSGLGPETPVNSDPEEIAARTSFKYPILLWEDITDAGTNYLTGIIGISKNVNIEPNVQLVLYDAKVYLINDAHLVVENGAQMIFGDDVQVFGSNNNVIEVEGALTFNFTTTGTIFNRDEGANYFGGIDLKSTAIVTSMDDVELNYTNFNSTCNTLNISNCVFNYSNINFTSPTVNITSSDFTHCGYIYSNTGNITFENSTFTYSGLFLQEQTNNSDLMAKVEECLFTSNQTYAAIHLLDYDKYYVYANDIQYYLNGIELYYTGGGHAYPNYQVLANNHITDCANTGMILYNSSGRILNNHIYNNEDGLRLLNESYTLLDGNPEATIYYNTQNIKDNDFYEVYASRYSFPYSFHYNIIKDDDNAPNSEYLVYWDREVGPIMDVRYNCWGNGFYYQQDLYPYQNYAGYDDVWCPGGTPPPPPDPDPAESLFYQGEAEFEAGNYSTAKSTFQSVIEQYPSSSFAKESIKELFRVEHFAGNDYQALKQYYLSNDSINGDSTLTRVAGFFANKCNIVLENWPEAITWYENIIMNPENLNDSVFAIIDLGYTYLLMENSGTKSLYEGSLKQYIPKSESVFYNYRDSLLTLIPGDRKSKELLENIRALSYGELIQNVPNPFTTSTEIWYILEKSAHVCITIYDLFGRKLDVVDLGVIPKGTQHFAYTNSRLKPGLYLYALIVDSEISDTKKLTVLE
ncbi:MAG: tetratricopeptide repeat protein [Bacteroidales bacterium]|nr:tetratricopeptide repeat protein [Bacteroidales bacterium]